MQKKYYFFFLCSLLFSITAHAYFKHFVIVIPSYNNAQWYERNVQSVLAQNYPHFDVLYTDDCSRDGTGDLVEEYLKENDIYNKVTLIKNNERKGALYNLYRMINRCDDESIIVTLDGDDWFPDHNVLTRLNDVYADETIWLTYGQFKLYPSGTMGWASKMPDYIIESNSFRSFQHLPTHLRTFYAWLFKRIKLEDLLYIGKFYPMTWDMVMMFPMIEMAGERHKFISDVMYIYNDNNSISDHNVSRQLQAHLAQVVKKKKRYIRLDSKPNLQVKKQKADVIIFAYDPISLSQILDSLELYVSDIDHVFIMYYPIDSEQAKHYDAIQNAYVSKNIQLYCIASYRSNFKELLCDIYKKSTNNYILFIDGKRSFNALVSLSDAIEILEETCAYAFYFNLNKSACDQDVQHSLIECRDNIFAWNFSLAGDKWSCANSLEYVLHKKTDMLASVLRSNYDLTQKGLAAVWANEGNLDRLGLCFRSSVLSV